MLSKTRVPVTGDKGHANHLTWDLGLGTLGDSAGKHDSNDLERITAKHNKLIGHVFIYGKLSQ